MTSWNEVRLEEVLSLDCEEVKIDPNTSYPMVGVYSFGRGLFNREAVAGHNTSYKKFFRLRAEHIVMSQLFGWEGALALSSEKFAGKYLSPQFPTFLVNDAELDRNFLGWLMKRPSFWRELGKKTRGMGDRRRTLNPQALLSMKIPLPPLPEQRRIVAKIERLAGKIEEARRVKTAALSNLAHLTSAIYGQVFSLRKGWGIKSVSEFCEKPQYGYTASASLEKVGPHLLRITDIQSGKVNWPSVPFCDCLEPGPYLLKKNDILFARTGATTGKSFLIKSCPDSVFASYLIRLRIKNSVLPEYLYAFFQTPDYWRQIADEVQGTGQPNCNGRKLSNLKVPIPSIQEQHQIVEYLDSIQAKVDRLKALQAKTSTELDALLPSILDKAFKGEL